MADRADNVLQGVMVPLMLDDRHLWSDEASYSEQGPRTGDAVAQTPGSELVMHPVGSMTSGQAIRTRVQRAGIPGRDVEATIITRNEADGDTEWRGRDLFCVALNEVIQEADHGGTTVTAAVDADTLTLPDGQIAVVYQEEKGSTRTVVLKVRDLNGAWTSTTLYTEPSAYGYSKLLCPSLCLHPNGRDLYVAHCVHPDPYRTQVHIRRAALTDLTSWSLISSSALRTALDTYTAGATPTGGTPLRMRLVAKAGQWLLTATVRWLGTDPVGAYYGWRDVHCQWASTDGLRYTLVELGNGNSTTMLSGWHDTTVHNGVFIFISQDGTSGGDDLIRVHRLGSAFDPLSSAESYTVTTETTAEIASTGGVAPYTVDEAEIACVVDDSNRLWVTYLVVGSGRQLRFAVSDDGGLTWATINSLPDWFSSDDVGTRPEGVALTYHRGRLVAAHNHLSDGSAGERLDVTYIGGHSQVTLPDAQSIEDYDGTALDQLSFTQTLYPYELPGAYTNWTGTGTATETLDPGGSWTIQGDVGKRRFYGYTIGTTVQHIHAMAIVQPTAGGSSTADRIVLQETISDGAGTDYRVTLRFDYTNNRMRLWDDAAGAQIGSDITVANWSQPVQVLLGLTITGHVAVFYRRGTLAQLSLWDRQWTSGPASSSLTNGAGTWSTSGIVHGHPTNATVDTNSTWYIVAYGTSQSFSPLTSRGDALADFVNPDSLHGHRLSGEGGVTYLSGGLSVYGNAGAAREGEEHKIAPSYDHPVANLLPGIDSSPLAGWRSAAVSSGAVAAQEIPVVLNREASTSGAEDEPMESDIVACAVLNTNAAQFVVQRRTGGAWVTHATIDTAYTATGCTRSGRIIRGGAMSGDDPYFGQDELKGWFVSIGSDIRRVTGNSAGRLSGAYTGKVCSIRVEGITGSESASGITLRLWPPSWSAVFRMNGIEASAWRLVVSSQTTIDNDIAAAAWWIGPVFAFGWRHSWGRVMRSVPNVSRRQRRDRKSIKQKTAEVHRLLRFAFADGLDLSGLEGDAPTPDHLTASTTSGAEPVAGADDVAYLWEGLVRRLDGPLVPLIYYPRIPRSTDPGDDITLYRRRRDFLVGEMTSEVQVQNVQGDEIVDEVVRVASIIVEELAGVYP